MDPNRALQPMDPNFGKRKWSEHDLDGEEHAKRMRAQGLETPFDARQEAYRQQQQRFDPRFGASQALHLGHQQSACHVNPIVRHEVPQSYAQQASYPPFPTNPRTDAHHTQQFGPKRLGSGASYHLGHNLGTPGAYDHRQSPPHAQAASSMFAPYTGSALPTLQAGTQADPIDLDDDLVPEVQAPALQQKSAKQVERKFYAVARGLLPGIYEHHEKHDAKQSINGWAKVKCRQFSSREEAGTYLRQNRLSENEYRTEVVAFFGTFHYPTESEWKRRRELYNWFMTHPRTKPLSWRSMIRAPREDAFFADEHKSGSVSGSELHEPSYRLEQYQLAPALSAPKRNIPPKLQNAPPPTHQHAQKHVNAANAGRVPADANTRKQTKDEPYPTDLQARLEQYEQAMIDEEARLIQHQPAQQVDLIATHMGVLQPPAVSQQAPAEAKVEPDLCPEQRRLVELILSGKNVFYTGSAGCGKSTVLKAFVKALKDSGREVKIVAPTGKAALEVNGTTYFTFAGWVPSHFKKPLKDLRRGAHQTWVNKRMRAVDVLIIDEISMLENHIFERLNEVMKEARGRNEAFGGVQIVVTGDFCQLPPVKPFKHCLECGREMMHRHYNNSFECRTHGSFPETDKWAFKSKAWTECNFEHVNLTTIHRQRDRAFIDILERCRMGKQLTSTETNLLLNHTCNVKNPTRLYSTRAEVNRLNEGEYAKLKSTAKVYQAFDDALIQPHHPNLQMKAERGPDRTITALREGKFEPRVDLKEGMRVVLQVNLSIDQGLVNGAQGVVVDWEPYDKDKLPRTEKKTGGSSRDKDPAAAMMVAPNTINGEHAQYREAKLKEFVKLHGIKEWPIVEFDNGLRRTIYAECLVYEFGDDPPYSIMSRTQVPLIAGWAMTVHKSQGMTLNQVEVDLGKAFEEGQIYVALSRATSLEGLKVRSLGTMTGGGNAEVHEFLREKFGLDV